MKRIGVAIIFQLISFAMAAQEKPENVELGIHAGLAAYMGDLTPSMFGSYNTPRFAAGVHANIIVSPSISIRPNFDFGNLEGDDSKFRGKEWREQRNLKFSTSFKEFSGLVVWNIFAKNYESGGNGLSPYLFAGVGYSFIETKRDYSKFNFQYFSTQPNVIAGLNEDISEPETRGIPVLPIGGGIRFSLTPGMSIKAEGSYRLSGSDYVDGYSKVAGGNYADQYYTAYLGLIFSLGKKKNTGMLDCPELKN